MTIDPVSAMPSRPQLLLSGLDSLYVSYYLELDHSRLDFDDLEYQRERVQEARLEEFAEIDLGSERFALMPYGKNPYRYVLGNEAFEVRLSEHMRPSAAGIGPACRRWQ